MNKAMIFIDGTWLYHSKVKLNVPGRDDFSLDYGKLPQVVAAEVAKQLGTEELQTVRTHLYGSYAANYDALDQDAAQRQKDFFNMLRERYHYEVDVFPIDFKGRRLRRGDRDPGDYFDPREKCVDIALASTLMYYAAIPHAYDLAIVVVGEQDFVPVLQAVRRLGKRVAIASIRECCCPEFSDPYDNARVKDLSTIWLDELLDRLELVYERKRLKCESPLHEGNPLVWTTYQPTRNGKFYCDECRELYARMKQESEPQAEGAPVATVPGVASVAEAPARYATAAPSEPEPTGVYINGNVKAKFEDRGYGFIHAENGRDYFFHFSDLQGGLVFDEVTIGTPLRFQVKREPVGERAGAAQLVMPPLPEDVQAAEGDVVEVEPEAEAEYEEPAGNTTQN